MLKGASLSSRDYHESVRTLKYRKKAYIKNTKRRQLGDASDIS